MKPHPLLSICLLLFASAIRADDAVVVPVPADAYVKQIAPLIEKHCIGYHGPDAQEGGVSYADLVDDQAALRRRPLWRRAFARVKSGECPLRAKNR